MDSIISYFEAHNFSMDYYQESSSSVNARIKTTIGLLLSAEDLAVAISMCWNNDKARISMESDLDERFVCDNNCVWQDTYKNFVDVHDKDDGVTINIHIDKNSEVIGIYKFSKYWGEISGKSIEELLNYFSELLQKRGTLSYYVLDESVEVITDFIHIGKIENALNYNRDERIRKYHAASLFLNRTNIILIPEDFRVINDGRCFEVTDLFRKIETALSIIYLANSAYISDGKLVFQLKPDITMECSLDSLNYNSMICELCSWVYDCDNAVERAGIARNIVSLHCDSIDEFLHLDSDVISSVKSNYVIYQRNTTQEYIETKNKIAESVVSLVKDQEELIKDIGDGFRNNFIAIFTFIITVVLTGVNADDLTANSLPPTIRFVTTLIIVASLAYLIVCLISSSIKIQSLEDVYGRIKDNYAEVLDPKDLEKAFGRTYDEAVSKVNRYRWCICTIWFIFIIIMTCLLVYFSSVSIQ